MAIPYRIAKFKSANIFTMAIYGPTAKFNSRQYFWLYGIYLTQIYKYGADTHVYKCERAVTMGVV